MIEILLSTYNGERFLKQQLDSIITQDWRDWRLLVRDDGSTDDTVQIIKKYIHSHSNKICLLNDNKGNLGSTLSYSILLEKSTSKYIMLCDQDDVWFNNKVSNTLNKMLALEAKYGKIPLMVFTDLVAVDENLIVLSDSFIKSQKLKTNIINDPTKLAAINVAAGCTCMINQEALKHVIPIKSKNITHDQWLAVNIAKYGKLHFMNEPTLLYRQHANNVFGANEIGLKYFLNKLKYPCKQYKLYHDLLSRFNFKISIGKFIFFKIYYNIMRLS